MSDQYNGTPNGQYPPNPPGQPGQYGPDSNQFHNGGQGWQPGYAGYPGYGSPYGYAPVAPSRSNVLGIVGLAVVVLALVGLVIGAFSFGQGLAAYILDVAATGAIVDEAELMNDPLTQAYAESAAGTIGLVFLACLVGFGGWIVSIVATAQRRGRGFGIAGIVLGVLSLGFGYAAWAAALFPALEQMGI